MKKKLVLFLISLCLVLSGRAQQEHYQFSEGVLRVSSWEGGVIDLSGEWFFYRGDFMLNVKSDAPRIDYPDNRISDGVQHGTYLIKVSVPEGTERLAIGDANITGARSYYVNGRYIGGSGYPGRSQAKEEPGLKLFPLSFDVPSREFELAVTYSQYHYVNNGLTRKIFLGPTGAVMKQENQKSYVSTLLQGVLTAMGVYYIALYLLGRKRFEFLFFAFMNLAFSLWIFSVSGTYFLFPPMISYGVVMKLGYSSILLSLLFYLLFITWHQSRPRFRELNCVISAVILLTLAGVIFLPVKSFTRALYLIYVEVLMADVIVLWDTIGKMKRGVQKGMTLLPGLAVLMATHLIDFLYCPNIVNDGILQLGFFALIAQQSLYHSYIHNHRFNQLRQINQKYEEVNRELTGLLATVEEQTRQIEFLNTTDALTGLPKGSTITPVYEREIKRHKRKRKTLAFLVLELADAKKILKHKGQVEFDRYVMEITRRLEKHIPDNPWIGRGGEERFPILAFFTPGKEREELKSLILSVIQPVEFPGDREVHIPHIALGCHLLTRDDEPYPQACRKVNLALEKSIQEGGNIPVVYNSRDMEDLLSSYEMTERLKKSLAKERLYVHYQPQICLERRDVYGLEALIRWKDPEWGSISPERFIPLAEECGFIYQLDLFVIEEVARQISRWDSSGHRPLKVSVNVSSLNFANPSFAGEIVNIVEKVGIDPSQLELELTERILIYNREGARRNMEMLKGKGFSLALDDFGTGYSSLSYLSDFTVDTLKIDKSFISGIGSCEKKRRIVNSIIGIGRSLGMNIVSEGVETEEELRYLEQEGVRYIQGFYFSRPLPARKIQDFRRDINRLIAQD